MLNYRLDWGWKFIKPSSIENYKSTKIRNTRPGGGIGRRKGLKIPREQSRAGSTPALGIKNMRKIYLLGILIIISSCSTKGLIPIPTNLLPELNTSPSSSANYGSHPKQYQKLLQTYLKSNLSNPHNAKIEFVNTPKKMAIAHLNDDLYGYRVCLSIDQKNNKNIYTGFKNHFFLIRDSSVIMHIYDSGLLKIPFELCVTRSKENTIYLDDIDSVVPSKETTVDQMDDPSLTDPKIDQEKLLREKQMMEDVYISCIVDSNEYTYVFNEYKNSLDQSIGTSVIPFISVEFSKTHVLGILGEQEVLINRVSGSIFIDESGLQQKGSCELKDKRKF